MAIDLEDFASGDTDYIAKLNNNNALLEAAVGQIQSSLGGLSAQGTVTVGQLYEALFKGVTTLIGPDSYLPQVSGTTLVCKRGGVYRSVTLDVVSTPSAVTLHFAGMASATYYLTVSSTGLLTTETTSSSDSIYSVNWNGTGFSALTLLVPTYYDGIESNETRTSAALGSTYPHLDQRLEASETIVKSNQTTAVANAVLLDKLKYRKIGCTFDGSTGIKGAIQIDFAGTIVGWSVILDVPGNVTIDIDRAVNPAPPMTPTVPNTTTNIISGSAPIASGGLQSASGSTGQVATWTKDLNMWDVIQFTVTSASGFSRGTAYVRVQQT